MWSAFGARAVTLVVNFVVPVNLNFREITRLEFVPILGEPLAVPVAKTHGWMLVDNAGIALFLAYLLDASVTAGGRVGGGKHFSSERSWRRRFWSVLIRAMLFVWGGPALPTPYLVRRWLRWECCW